MPARRNPPGLKLLDRRLEVAPDVVAAAVGGVGLDWTDEPDLLDPAGLAEWRRLAVVYAETPVRFREGDRVALTSFCLWVGAFDQAARDVQTRGLVVDGRSSADRGRLVKNPAAVAMREASTQVRYWCRELCLSPDSRGRSGISDGPDPAADESNPFAGGPA